MLTINQPIDAINKKRHSVGLVALAAAAISSSMFLSTENQTKLKEKLIAQQKKLDKKFEKTLFLKNNNPVKITVQSDGGSIASYTSTKKPNELIEETIMKSSSNVMSTSADLALVNQQYSKQLSNSSNISKSSERVNSSISSSNSNDHKRNSSRSRMSNTGLNQFKTTNEVLILIETWIKNAPNDFMGIFRP